MTRHGMVVPVRESSLLSEKYNEQVLVSDPYALTAYPTNPHLINGITQGTGDGNRVGSKVQLVSLHLTVELYGDKFLEGGEGDVNHKVYIVWDKYPNGNQFSTNDLGLSYGTYINKSNEDRFEVLAERHFYAPGEPFLTVDLQNKHSITKDIDIDLSKKKLLTRFSGNGNTIGSISEGALFLVAVKAGQYASDIIRTTHAFRLKYKDSL